MVNPLEALKSFGNIYGTALLGSTEGGRTALAMQEKEKQRRQTEQATLAYLDPNSSPEIRSQAASMLVNSGAASLSDLAKYEELNRPKPLNAPNVQFNPATGEVMVSQYDPNTGQLSINNPQLMGSAPASGGASLGDLANYGQPMPTAPAGMTPKARAEYEGEIAKGTAKNEIERSKKAVGAQQSNEILDRAEKLLPNATGSGAGALLAQGKQFIGMSDDQTKADRQLELYSGWLVSNVPRMEGPQSNFDVENYRAMAADVGNKNIPVEDRLAALKGLRELNEKYSSGKVVGTNSANDGMTATNPKTGQKLVLRGGKWQPL